MSYATVGEDGGDKNRRRGCNAKKRGYSSWQSHFCGRGGRLSSTGKLSFQLRPQGLLVFYYEGGKREDAGGEVNFHFY